MNEKMTYETHDKEMNRLKYAHEGEVARLELHNKRLFILTLVIFLALIATNGAWIIRESMYEDIVTEQTVSSDGSGDVTVNGVGDINYGYNGETDGENTP